jgi:hypothetical protein
MIATFGASHCSLTFRTLIDLPAVWTSAARPDPLEMRARLLTSSAGPASASRGRPHAERFQDLSSRRLDGQVAGQDFLFEFGADRLYLRM